MNVVDTAKSLRDRARKCRELASQNGCSELGYARLMGKAIAYEHAAEIVEQEAGPAPVGESINGLTSISGAWSCERCKAIFVGEYFSAAHCNKTGSDVVLCEDCCVEADQEHDAGPVTITREHGLWIARRGQTVIGESTSAEMLGSIIDQEARGES